MASGSFTGGGTVPGLTVSTDGIQLGFFLKVGSYPSADTMLADLYGGAVGYVRLKMTAAGTLVMESAYAGDAAESTPITTTPIPLNEWDWVTLTSQRFYAYDDVRVGATITRPDGSLFGAQQAVVGVSGFSFPAILGLGVAYSAPYANVPNDASAVEMSKVELRTIGATNNAPEALPMPTSDASGDLLDYNVRQPVGPAPALADSGASGTHLLVPGPQGLSILADGPYPSAYSPQPNPSAPPAIGDPTASGSFAGPATVRGMTFDPGGTQIGFFLKIGAYPAQTTALADLDGGAIGYLRASLTPDGRVLLEGGEEYEGTGSCTAGTTPLPLSQWEWVSVTAQMMYAYHQFRLGVSILDPGGVSRGSCEADLGYANTPTWPMVLGVGAHLSSTYADAPADPTQMAFSKVIVRNDLGATNSAPDAMPLPTSDPSGHLADYPVRQATGSVTQIDNGDGTAFPLQSTGAGLVVDQDGPYVSAYAPVPSQSPAPQPPYTAYASESMGGGGVAPGVTINSGGGTDIGLFMRLGGYPSSPTAIVADGGGDVFFRAYLTPEGHVIVEASYSINVSPYTYYAMCEISGPPVPLHEWDWFAFTSERMYAYNVMNMGGEVLRPGGALLGSCQANDQPNGPSTTAQSWTGPLGVGYDPAGVYDSAPRDPSLMAFSRIAVGDLGQSNDAPLFMAAPMADPTGDLHDYDMRQPIGPTSGLVDFGTDPLPLLAAPQGMVLAMDGPYVSSYMPIAQMLDSRELDSPSELCGCVTGRYGKPVNAATGDFYHTFDDLTIPGRGLPLHFTHTYHAYNAGVDGPLGYGWTMPYSMYLSEDASGAVTVNEEGGTAVTFTYSGTGYEAPSRVLASLTSSADGSIVTFTRNDQEKFIFTAPTSTTAGLLMQEVDRNGYATTLAYTGGQLMRVTDPAGRSLTFGYDLQGHITTVHDPIGRTLVFTYSPSGDLSAVQDVGGGVTRFTYYPNHLLQTMTDPRGGMVANVYDAAGRVVQQTDALGHTTGFAYLVDSANVQTTVITDPVGNVTDEVYKDNLLESRTTGVGTRQQATWRYTYDPATLGVASETDPNGHTSYNTYDANGNRLSHTDALGRTTHYKYDALNDVTSVTDPLGVTTQYTYDTHGNLLSVSRPVTVVHPAGSSIAPHVAGTRATGASIAARSTGASGAGQAAPSRAERDTQTRGTPGRALATGSPLSGAISPAQAVAHAPFVRLLALPQRPAARLARRPSQGTAHDTTIDDSTRGTGPNRYHYSGPWTHCAPCRDGAAVGMYDRSSSTSHVKNASYSITFTGTRIAVYSVHGPTSGMESITVDHGRATIVDLYRARRSGDVLDYTSPLLAPGRHTLLVRVLGRKRRASHGTDISADRVVVTGAPRRPSYTVALGTPRQPAMSRTFTWHVRRTGASSRASITALDLAGCWAGVHGLHVTASGAHGPLPVTLFRDHVTIHGLSDAVLPATITARFSRPLASAGGATRVTIHLHNGTQLRLTAAGPICGAPPAQTATARSTETAQSVPTATSGAGTVVPASTTTLAPSVPTATPTQPAAPPATGIPAANTGTPTTAALARATSAPSLPTDTATSRAATALPSMTPIPSATTSSTSTPPPTGTAPATATSLPSPTETAPPASPSPTTTPSPTATASSTIAIVPTSTTTLAPSTTPAASPSATAEATGTATAGTPTAGAATTQTAETTSPVTTLPTQTATTRPTGTPESTSTATAQSTEAATVTPTDTVTTEPTGTATAEPTETTTAGPTTPVTPSSPCAEAGPFTATVCLTYDPAHPGDVIARTNPDGFTTHYTYDADGDLASVSDPLGNTTTYTYDGIGRRTSMVRPLGNVTSANPISYTTSYTYNAFGETTAITDALGHVTTYQYDADQNLITTTDVLGRETVNRYDLDNELTSVHKPDGGAWLTGYDPAGNVITTTDPLGHSTVYTYDPLNRRTAVTDALGRTTTTGYDPAGNVITVTAPAGNATVYGYDAAGERTSVTRPDGGVWSTGYDADGRVITTTDALGNLTEYSYDSLGRRISVIDPLNRTTLTGYDLAGNVITTTDAMNRVTVTQYDAANRPILVTQPDGSQVRTTYDADGNVTAVTDPNGHTTTYGYDVLDRRITTTDPLGHITHDRYDAVGNQTSVIDANGHTTTYGYDALDRVITTTNALGHSTIDEYDLAGNLVGETDPLSHTTRYRYDAADERTTVIQADGSVLGTGYDPNGNVITQTDALGRQTSYGYDAVGQVVTTTNPLTETTAYTYDLDGNRTALIDPMGRSTSYGYDADSEPITITYSDGVTPNVRFTYYPSGQRETMTDGTGMTTYRYDLLDRPITVTNGAGQTLGYGYDRAGNLTTITYPDSSVITRTYDAADRWTGLTDPFGHTIQFGYDPGNRLTSTLYPTSAPLTSTTSYNDADQITGITDQGRADLDWTFTYGRDNDGQVTSAVDPVSGQTHTYRYNPLNQLTGDQQTSGTSTTTLGYSPDSAYEITQTVNGATNATSGATYDAASELTQLQVNGPSPATDTYGYNADGDRTGVTATGSGTSSSYGYDQADRLIAATIGITEASYSYDGDGLRQSKTVTTTAGVISTRETWDTVEGLPLLVQDGTTKYLTGPDGLPLEAISGTTVEYLLHDQLGSTRGILSGAGTLIGTATYDPYGNLTAQSGTATPFGFAGQYTDAETGFQYLRARYYDPATQVFLARDPLVNLSAQPYAYTADDPLNASDPSGQLQCNGVTGANWTWERLGSAFGDTLCGVGNGIGSGAQDAWTGATQTGAFVWRSTGDYVFDRASFDQQWAQTGETVCLIQSDPGGAAQAIWTGLSKPYADAWQRGDYGYIVGRGEFDFFSAVVTAKGLDKLRYLAFARATTASDWAGLSGMLRAASSGKGNFGIGSGTLEQATALGEAWVGPGYKVASDGKTLISSDGLRQFRPPSYKPNLGRIQANLEWRPEGMKQWQGNAHIDVLP